MDKNDWLFPPECIMNSHAGSAAHLTITINLGRKVGQPVRLSFHLVPKLQ